MDDKEIEENYDWFKALCLTNKRIPITSLDPYDYTHLCKCGKRFHSDKALAKCPKGCEGLIIKNKVI